VVKAALKFGVIIAEPIGLIMDKLEKSRAGLARL
jgi:hypothetical protein